MSRPGRSFPTRREPEQGGRSRLRRSAIRAGFIAELLLSAALASARAQASEPVRLEYHVPPGPDCPSEPVFVGRVRERSLHLRDALEGELARSFVVTVTLEEAGALARVEFVDPDGSAISRSVRGATCDEVVSGIALVTALAIDARAVETPEPQPATTVPPPAPATPPPPPPEPAPTPPSKSVVRFTAGIGSGWTSYAGPSGALLLDAFFAAGFGESGPLLRAGAFHLRSELPSSDGREGRLRLWGGKLEGCPLSVPLSDFFFEPCAGTNLGVLLSSAAPAPGLAVNEEAQLWWDLVLLGRLGVLLEQSVVLEVQGELGVPLTDPSFGFDNQPEEPVFEVPAVGASIRIGAGIRFP